MPQTSDMISCMAVAGLALLLAADRPSTTQPASATPAQGDQTISLFAHDQVERQLGYEVALRDMISPQRLREFHDMTSSQPHVAGTPGDARLCDRLVATFREMGLNVERHEIEIYLASPVSASLSIVEPEPIDLPLIEKALPEDPDTFNPELTFGWNAFSGSGEVTAQVVYANYGTKEDFQRLADLGVECDGKIVLTRYGGNFRGYKAKFAEQAGAAGLIIYTDPKDSGFTKGPVYPEGGYANESFIQRGSILTLDYAGDPLTPFDEASPGVERLDPKEVALPTIPVQPVGWAAAQEIMSRMTGDTVPEDWAGTMPITYRLTGGPELQVRLVVKQERRLTTTWNIVATLPGTDWPAERVIIGAHHDAWSFGAGDPNCGTIAVLEAARCFSNLAKQGRPPRRSILFACWAAEEFGMFGSTEWVESREQMLTSGAVAYFNLDMASMGSQFGCSASPSLKPVIMDATRYVTQPPIPGDKSAAGPGGTVFDRWLRQAREAGQAAEPSFGDLGGGSDHVGFYCHLGIPSAGLGGSGAEGVSYHSNYDTLTWYRRFVGSDYASAQMITQVTSLAAARLANSPIESLDPGRYATDLPIHLEALSKRAAALGFLLPAEPESKPDAPVRLLPQFAPLIDAARSLQREADLLNQMLHTPAIVARQDEQTLARINRSLLMMERNWVARDGLPTRPWYRNGWAATDEDSGYASWMLPRLRAAIEHRDRAAFDEALRWYANVLTVTRNIVRLSREAIAL